MLPGGGHATISSDAKGVTFQNKRYEKDIRGSPFNIFDTVGLNEGAGGATVSPAKAIEGLYRLMRALDGGIHLLVQVVRGPRVKPSNRKNYEMFYEIFCEKQVPIVLVITGLENEDDMDAWWTRNHEPLREQGMSFDDAACITATEGWRAVFAKRFEESKGKIEKLISDRCCKIPWEPPEIQASRLTTILVKTCNTILPFKTIVIAESVYQALKSFGDMTDKAARKEANKIHENSLRVRVSPWTNVTVPNVVIFGETGVGKSSVVNMLTGGGGAARVSPGGKGVTLQNERYEKDIRGSRFNIFDTVGLDEGAAGTVSAEKANEGLYRLLSTLDGGINLLVYVVRGPRIKSSIQKNYLMFFEICCKKQVPIVLVITGLENEDDMDAWWDGNHGSFREQGMTFSAAACITATRGRRNVFAKEFEESKEKIEGLILDHCSETPWLPPAGM